MFSLTISCDKSGLEDDKSLAAHVMKALSAGYWEYSPSSSTLWLSQDVMDLFGIAGISPSIDDAIRIFGKTFVLVENLLLRLTTYGEPFDAILHQICLDGVKKDIRISGTSLICRSGEPGIGGMITDVSVFNTTAGGDSAGAGHAGTSTLRGQSSPDRNVMQLKERVKELNTLYSFSKIIQSDSHSLHEVLEELVRTVPPGWQYPEITETKIQVGELEWTTDGYQDFPWKQTAHFSLPSGVPGKIRVVYREEKPSEDEGPFLKEERNLINLLADILRVFLSRRYEVGELMKSRANLSATINNSSTLIWSVDRDYRIITCNEAFRNFIQLRLGIRVEEGKRVLPDYLGDKEAEAFRERWTQRYNRALSGEAFKLEEERSGRYLHYSFNPIIEDGFILGVAAFAEDVTPMIQKEKELAEANKKIGEIRLMALRSAMNPHFIFNALNSIQYFIASNDRKNAITYLSTFSKLIRGILTLSQSQTVTLAREIELLECYIQLEMARFSNKFEYQIDIDPEVDSEVVEIPSLLIQPVVENAILHGLCNKPGPGRLIIGIRREEKLLLITVEDDGVGRKKAGELNRQTKPGHKSFGTSLTEERLRNLGNAAMVTEDLYDAAGNAAGTRAKISVTAAEFD